MIAATGRPSERPARRGAFTLVECIVSVVVVATMLVAALGAVGASRLSRYKTSDLSRGQLLAQDLMAEILRQSYEEPVAVPRFGPEGAAESLPSRAYYDDVDDYCNWTGCPPQNKDGTRMADLAGWRRSVSVDRVDPFHPERTSTTETGVKRVTVTVTHDGAKVAELVALRAQALEPRSGQSK